MFKVLCTFLIATVSICHVSCDIYEDNVKFVLYNDRDSQISSFELPLSEQGCNPSANFSFVTHGWLGSNSPWILELISNLGYHRGGCVIFMNYSYFGDRENYIEVISFFEPISNLMTRKLQQISDEGADSDKIFMFGFSLGGRIVIEAALNFGGGLIGQIDSKVVILSLNSRNDFITFVACDMAGPGFDFFYTRDPKDAAKNVQCIHTSNNAGTKERNCHQNWLMGHCGLFQDSANVTQAFYCTLVNRNCLNKDQPLFSHSTCPYFYNSAFKNDFVADNRHKCLSSRMVKNLPGNFKMGFMESRKK